MLLLPLPTHADKAGRGGHVLTVFLPATGFTPTSRAAAFGHTVNNRRESPGIILATSCSHADALPPSRPDAPKPIKPPVQNAALQITDLRVPSAYWQARDKQHERAQAMLGGEGCTVQHVPGTGWRIARRVSSPASSADARTLPPPAPAPAAAIAPPLDSFQKARLHQPPPSFPPVPGLIPMTDRDAWRTPMHFGTNQGVWFCDLSAASREWYFDTWFAEREKDPRLLRRADLPLFSALHQLVRGSSSRENTPGAAKESVQPRGGGSTR